MRFENVCIESVSHVAPERVVSSLDIEARLEPLYARLCLSRGRLELMSGIRERRFWPAGTRPSDGAVRAGRLAIEASGVDRERIGCLIHASVSRDFMEPATASVVHGRLELRPACTVFDLSNACLGFANAMTVVASMIERREIDAALVVAAENGEPLVEATLKSLLDSHAEGSRVGSAKRSLDGSAKRSLDGNAERSRDGDAKSLLDSEATSSHARSVHNTLASSAKSSLTDTAGGDRALRSALKRAYASLTIGSGAAAMLLAHRSLATSGHRLLGGRAQAATQHVALCQGDLRDGHAGPLMETDAEALLAAGNALAAETWRAFLDELGWSADDVRRIVTHQVGTAHRRMLFETLRLDPRQDFPTVETFGNVGSVSLPLSLSLAQVRGFVRAGDKLALLGIGSGLNCLMLGVEW